MTAGLPETACWQHVGARAGFEVAYFRGLPGRSVAGMCETLLEADGAGHWVVDGSGAPELDGSLDVDLESSAMTNTLPVHRLALAVGEHAGTPAAYVRAGELGVGRLEQSYRRIADEGGQEQYDYAAPAFAFTARLVYDGSGLLLDYPGIARRAG